MYASMDDESGQQLKSNMFSLSGNGFFGAVGRSINLGKKLTITLMFIMWFLDWFDIQTAESNGEKESIF